jgi:hypothetical protein
MKSLSHDNLEIGMGSCLASFLNQPLILVAKVTVEYPCTGSTVWWNLKQTLQTFTILYGDNEFHLDANLYKYQSLSQHLLLGLLAPFIFPTFSTLRKAAACLFQFHPTRGRPTTATSVNQLPKQI